MVVLGEGVVVVVVVVVVVEDRAVVNPLGSLVVLVVA